MIILVFLGLILLAGLLMLLRGWRGRPELTHPTCARCGYDLRARDPSAPRQCPECGADLSHARAVNFGRYRRCRWMIAGGLALMLLPVLLVLTSAIFVQRTITRGPASLVSQPTAQLLAGLPAQIEQPWTWNELQRRHSSGALSAAETGSAIDALIAHLQDPATNESASITWAQQFLAQVLAGNAVDEPRRLRLYDAFLTVPPDVAIRQRLRAGAKQTLSVDPKIRGKLPGVGRLYCLRSATIDDTLAVELNSGPGERQLCNREPFSIVTDVEIHADPGPHTLKLQVEMALIDAEEGELSPGDLRRLPERWPVTLRRVTQTVSVPIEVLPPGISPIELVRDPALAARMREGIRIRRLRVERSPRAIEVQLQFTYDKRPPAPVSMDVIATYEGGGELNLGHYSASGRGSSGQSGFSRRVDAFPAGVSSVTIILRPNVQRVERRPDMDRIWGDEIVFTDIPVAYEEDVPQEGQP